MPRPNMSLAAFNRWTSSQAFREYRKDRGAGKVDRVVARTRRVLRGNASKAEVNKVKSFIARMKANAAGERKYGNPPISAKTASLRNWGYDPTGKY